MYVFNEDDSVGKISFGLLDLDLDRTWPKLKLLLNAIGKTSGVF